MPPADATLLNPEGTGVRTPSPLSQSPVQSPEAPGPIETGQDDHWAFFSPNTDEGLSYEQAYARMGSTNQQNFKKMTADVFRSAGLTDEQVQSFDAIGDWNDGTYIGAENSLVHVIKGKQDPNLTKYLASWYGLLANQKGVVHFYGDEEGPDSAYQIHIPDSDTQEIRKKLDKFGVAFRTIVPRGNGNIVLVYDPGRGVRKNINVFAEEYDAVVRETTGRGDFLGGDTRTHARADYRKRIRQYESQLATGGVKQDPATGAISEGAGAPGSDPSGKPSSPKSLFQYRRRGPVLRTSSVEKTFLRQFKKSLDKKVKFAARKAPEGGMVHRGIAYEGGAFIPNPSPVPPQIPQVQQQPVKPQSQAQATPVGAQPAQPLPKVPAQPRRPVSSPTGDIARFNPDEFDVTQWDEDTLEKMRRWNPKTRMETGRDMPLKEGEQQLTLPGFESEGVSYGATYDKVKGLFVAHQEKHAHLGQAVLKHHYQSAVKVWKAMPREALKRFKVGARKYSFFGNLRELTGALKAKYQDSEITDEMVKKGAIGGCYDFRTGRLWLDGGYVTKSKSTVTNDTKYANQIYAHEFGHAIDGADKQEILSDKPSWRKVEPETEYLSLYATTHPREAFAEFSRLLYARQAPLEIVEEVLPRMSAFFKDHNLWPKNR